jgi:hypothetical protein
VPCDVIWLDIEHTDGKRYVTWDGGLFPVVAGACTIRILQYHRGLHHSQQITANIVKTSVGTALDNDIAGWMIS